MRRSYLWILLIGSLLLGACEFSLAGDITPPPGSVLLDEAATPEPVAFPEAEPDPVNGGAIFTQSCAPCHGATGLGDGEQSGQLPVAVPAIGDPELAQASSPESWYTIISQGNIDSFMPPFAQSLTVQDRWDVLAYVYSLSQQADLIASGEQLAVELGLEQNDLQMVALFSQTELGSTLAQDLGIEAPDGQALAAYMQAETLGLFSPVEEAVIETTESVESEPSLQATETETLAEENAPAEVESAEGVSIRGEVSNGSNGEIPVGSEVLLRGFDQNNESTSVATELEADGTYQFEAQILEPGLVYAVTIDYQGLIYFSEAISAEDQQDEYDLPIVIYDTTSDISSLAINSLQLVLDYPENGMVRVVQLVTISNSGDMAVAPISDNEPVIFYGLPPEASNLAFQSGTVGDRYILTEDGFGDLRAVLPGSGDYQMLYAYELPYNRSLDYEQSLFLPVNQVTVFTLASHTELTSSDFIFLGNQQLDNEVFAGYHSQQAYAAGDTLRFEIRGAHPLGSSNALLELLGRSDFLIGLLALALSVAAAWLWFRRQDSTGPSPEDIMDAIIALDARYAEDDISDDAYLKRRTALKERLQQALAEKKRAKSK